MSEKSRVCQILFNINVDHYSKSSQSRKIPYKDIDELLSTTSCLSKAPGSRNPQQGLNAGDLHFPVEHKIGQGIMLSWNKSFPTMKDDKIVIPYLVQNAIASVHGVGWANKVTPKKFPQFLPSANNLLDCAGAKQGPCG